MLVETSNNHTGIHFRIQIRCHDCTCSIYNLEEFSWAGYHVYVMYVNL